MTMKSSAKKPTVHKAVRYEPGRVVLMVVVVSVLTLVFIGAIITL